MAEEGLNLRPEVMKIITDRLFTYLNEHQDKIGDEANIESISFLSKHVIDWYNKDGDWNHRVGYIQIMRLLRKNEQNDQLAFLNDRIQEFTANAPYSSYQILDKVTLEWLITSFSSHFRVSAVRELPILDLGIRYVNPNEIGYLVSDLLDRVTSLATDQKEPYYDAIIKLKCANDPSLINRFYEELLIIKAQNIELPKKYAKSRVGVFNPAQKKMLKAPPVPSVTT